MIRLSAADSFQKSRLQELKLQPFTSLAKLPRRQKLQTPHLSRGLNIYQCRKNGEHGGIEITIRVEQRALLIFAVVLEDGFEIFPDGKIVDLNDGEYDPDD